jgi:pyruvyltransferase
MPGHLLKRKIVKLLRAARWQHARGERVPVFWHVGRPNFGDDINPLLLEHISGRPMRLSRWRLGRHILGMGSILGLANHHSIVLGSGLLEARRQPIDAGAVVVAVRGELSLASVPVPDGVLLGDPMVLAADLLPATPPKAFRYGFLPHVRSLGRWTADCRGRHLIIDPGLDPQRVVEMVASCEMLVSQSLHGLIAADALGIPNVWVAPSAMMAGGDFKFRDYFSTLDRAKPMIGYAEDIFAAPGGLDAEVANYRFPLDQYRRALAGAIDGHFPSAGRSDRPGRRWPKQSRLRAVGT